MPHAPGHGDLQRVFQEALAPGDRLLEQALRVRPGGVASPRLDEDRACTIPLWHRGHQILHGEHPALVRGRFEHSAKERNSL